jgi:predicted HAD superfamily phosphohydrolase YqeG
LNKIGHRAVFYIDVDDTLVRFAGSKRIPVPSVISLVRALHERGAVLYCWSTGGAEYARQIAVELKLADCFVAFLPKPNVVIDDQDIDAWKNFVVIHPLNVGGSTLDEIVRNLRPSVE